MAAAEIQKKFKSFHYETGVEWAGNRAGIIFSNGKPEIRVSSPPEFKGEAGVWTPEDLFVAALETCTMTTFLAFAERLNLPVTSYTSHALGFLENVTGSYQFTKIVLKPTIVIADEALIDLAGRTLDDAHQKCFIANSIRAEVILEPKFITASEYSCAT